jgi:opacity protein-like surface antigen
MDRRVRVAGSSGLGLLLGLFLPVEGLAADWSAVGEQKVLYTDDVFQLSSARRLALAEDPSQPTIVPVDKPSDVVWEPSLEVTRSSASRLGKTELSVKAHGFIFTDHAIFNHGNYRLQLKQALSPGTSLLLRYRYVPNLFLGSNFERRSGTRSLQEERVTSHIWRAQLERRLSDAWTVTMTTRFGLRFYNEVFDERDTKFYTVGPHVDYAVLPKLTLSLGYQYERGLADGRGDTALNDDISYRQHFVSTGADLKITSTFALNLQYAFRRKDFTTDLAGDTHLGRHDTTHQGTAELRYTLSDPMSIMLGFQRTQRISNVTIKGFHDTNTSLGVQYRF